MSDISFSHQFSQHWRLAPEKIKQAIIQELDDIVRLLDKETELKNFSFQCADLDAYIDDNYAQFIEEENALSQANHHQDCNNSEYKEQINQANLEETNNIATTTLVAPNSSKGDQSKESQVNTYKTEEGKAKEIKEEESLISESLVSESPISEHIATKSDINPSTEELVELENNDNHTGDPYTQSTLTKSDLLENHAYVIQELETHIDDYLSEHMTSLSEDLKKWLRDEVRQRINSL